MRRLITYLLLFSSSMLYAYELEVNGVYIGIIGTRIAYVTSRGEETSEPCYSGDVVVPEQVTYNGRVYNVTSVADNAFACFHRLHKFAEYQCASKYECHHQCSLYCMHFVAADITAQASGVSRFPDILLLFIPYIFCLAASHPHHSLHSYAASLFVDRPLLLCFRATSR